MKKVYSLEFIYSREDEVIKEYSINDINVNDKDKVIEDTCNKLIYEEKALNLIVKEVCFYKVI